MTHTRRGRQVFTPLFVCLLVVFGVTARASATTFVVTRTDDVNRGTCAVGDCSLREAIVAANASAGADDITLGVSQMYTLSLGPADAPTALVDASGDLDITETLTINGNGSTIDGNSLDRVLHVAGAGVNVTLNDLTIVNGVARGFLSLGGGLYIRDAQVTLNNSHVNSNSTLDTDASRDDGGGVAVVGTFNNPGVTLASLTLDNSSISSNDGLNGGGILCVLCALDIKNSSGITQNAAHGPDGGAGIDMVGDASTLSVKSSALINNNAVGTRGGGFSFPVGSSVSRLITRNRIVDNFGTTGRAIYFGAAGTIDATNNWWGCNFGPNATGAGCAASPNDVFGSVPVSPYLVLKGSASPATILPGGQSTATADLTFNKPPDADTSAGGTIPATQVTFGATLGTFATPAALTTLGKATDVFTAGGAGGTAALTAAVDSQTVQFSVEINSPPTITPIGNPTIDEDTSTGALAFTIGDAETLPGSLSLSGSSSNLTLVPNANIVFGGSDAGRTVTIAPAANQFGTAMITVTVSDGTSSTPTSFLLTVNAIGDAPTVSSATTNEDTQSISGLVLSRNVADGAEITHFKITSITNGTLFKNDGVTPIANSDVITFAEGNAGLRFTPSLNFFGTASFVAQAATSAAGTGAGAGTTAEITVNAVADTPSVTNATTLVNTQTTSGLVISRNAADGPEVTHFKITAITGGTLFQNDGVTPIADGAFITVAQGNAGLRFTPTFNSIATGHFTVQASVNATDGGLGVGTATADITLDRLSSSIALSTSATPVSFGDPVTFTANVSPLGAGSSGSVQFRDGGATLGPAVPLASGIATLTTSSLTPGVHIITAEYSGNTLYLPSVGTLAGGEYVKALTFTVINSSANPSTPGELVTFTATISPTLATGTVAFKEGAATLSTTPVVGGTALFTTAALTLGTHQIVAEYSGDATFTGSSGSIDQVVGCPAIIVAPVTLAAPVFNSPYGPITFTQTGGFGATTFALTGVLPAGLAFDAPTATLSGTPTVIGTFNFTVTATDSNGCSGSRAYSVTVGSTITVSTTPTVVNFGAVLNGASLSPVTPAQIVTIAQTSGPAIPWTVSVNQPWLNVTPTSGSGPGVLTVSIVNPPSPNNLPATGLLPGTITLNTTNAANSPTVAVNLTMLTAAQLTGPVGSFDTPADGQGGVTGSIGVTGWAIDDIGATTIEIWRGPVSGESAEVFLGFGTFVFGARPDVAALFPTKPYFKRAGWGYMLLTNFLPNQGNGTFTLRAYAKDIENNRVLLGQKTITCTNATATAPFGTIDTPEQGGTASGTSINFGWVLAAQPASSGLFIPIDGSTINVFIDGIDRGIVDSYNNLRPDIQALFPTYFNANGAVGVKFIDTTAFTNGTHTISWLARDNMGNAGGIGSRFFTIANSSLAAGVATEPAQGTGEPAVIDASTPAADWTRSLDAIDRSASGITVRHGFDDRERAEIVTADATGVHTVHLAPLDRIVIDVGPAHGDAATYRGYVIDGDALRELPVGSTLDPHAGEFVWAPGPGFGGTHALVFVRDAHGVAQQIRVNVTITPR